MRANKQMNNLLVRIVSTFTSQKCCFLLFLSSPAKNAAPPAPPWLGSWFAFSGMPDFDPPLGSPRPCLAGDESLGAKRLDDALEAYEAGLLVSQQGAGAGREDPPTPAMPLGVGAMP